MPRPHTNPAAAGPQPGAGRKNIISVLKAAEVLETKTVLPAEILATILDYLPVPDQIRVARTSRRMREMVYDDTRWVARLQSMGCWNEAHARRHFEAAMARRRRDTAAAAAAAAAAGDASVGGGVLLNRGLGPGAYGSSAASRERTASGSTTLFDATLEEEKRRQAVRLHEQQRLENLRIQQQQQQQQQIAQARDGFETLTINGGTAMASGAAPRPPNPKEDPEALLNILKTVRSVRGHAREEYGRVYGALAPFYWDLQRARTHADPVVFKVFRDPERQARMLSLLRTFARSDWAQGWRHREDKLANMTGIFEAAVLREFEQAYEFWDVDGRMHTYAHVLDVLNGSTAAVDLFLQKHPIFSDPELAASNALDCLHLAAPAAASAAAAVTDTAAAWGMPSSAAGPAASSANAHITLEPSRIFFERLAAKVNEQGVVIGRIFPRPARVFWAFVDKVREDIIMEYITPLLDEAHEHNLPAYLTAVSGLFEQCLQFLKSLTPPIPPEALQRQQDQQQQQKTSNGMHATDGSAGIADKGRFHKRASMSLGKAKGGDGSNGGAENGNGKADDDDDDDDDDGDDDSNDNRDRPDRSWTPRARERRVRELAFRTFEPHLDLYLQEELDYFTTHAEAEVLDWDKKLSEQDASAESFYMGNFNRQEVKKDFLSSFKKVVMMPVTALPSLPGQLLPFGGSGTASGGGSEKAAVDPAASNPQLQPPRPPSVASSGRATPVLFPGAAGGSRLPEKAPDDELAAKSALMASRLEGIKSLFSIEVALNLVHTAKASLGRAAVFVQLGGQAAGEAREQCEAIFVVLLRVLGNGHVKQGFDRAVEHLSQYNPRAVRSHRDRSSGTSGSADGPGSGAAGGRGDGATGGGGDGGADGLGEGGVVPLMMFIELVNVGDLISQMIDMFFEQQLAGPKIVDRNDFLDPAGLAKKRFEQMIDESVAAGLNKGIDVLMDEVEYICATTQKPTDYYPEAAEAVAESGLFFLTGGSGGGGSGGGGDRSSTASALAASNRSSLVSNAAGAGAGAGAGTGAGTAATGLDPFAAGDLGPTQTAQRVVALVRGHTSMLTGSTEKTMLDVFNGEVGLRLFTALCKHLKRQRISMAGAVHVIADMTLYFDYVRTLRNPDLLAYFRALRELSQLYLIDARHHAKEMAVIIADSDRFGGVFRAEEVYEFAERRADWYQVKRNVERAMYGLECGLM